MKVQAGTCTWLPEPKDLRFDDYVEFALLEGALPGAFVAGIRISIAPHVLSSGAQLALFRDHAHSIKVAIFFDEELFLQAPVVCIPTVGDLRVVFSGAEHANRDLGDGTYSFQSSGRFPSFPKRSISVEIAHYPEPDEPHFAFISLRPEIVLVGGGA